MAKTIKKTATKVKTAKKSTSPAKKTATKKAVKSPVKKTATKRAVKSSVKKTATKRPASSPNKKRIKKELPEGFQTAEFVLEHGFLDFITHRKDLKETLGKILRLFQN